MYFLFFFKVKQYIVILSWQFDTHVKESKNYTVSKKVLKGTVDAFRIEVRQTFTSLKRSVSFTPAQ